MMPMMASQVLPRGALVDFLEHLFKPRHVLFGFGLVLLEGGFQILGLGGLRHFRQGATGSSFPRSRCLSGVVKQFLQVLLAGHGSLLLDWDRRETGQQNDGSKATGTLLP